MSIDERSQKVIAMIERQIRSLDNIVEQADLDRDFDAAKERLARWRTRTVELLSGQVYPEEVHNFKAMAKTSISSTSNRRLLITLERHMYRNFLSSLAYALQTRPEHILMAPFPEDVFAPRVEVPQPAASQEDHALLEMARDLAKTAEPAAAEVKLQDATAKDLSYSQNVDQYNRLVAEARKRYAESGLVSALPDRIEPVGMMDRGFGDYLSEIERNKHIEVAGASRRLVIALEAIIGAYPESAEVLQAVSLDFIATEELRRIAERDRIELVAACRTRLWKCVVLLCGGLAEGMLCDKLREREKQAHAEYKAQWPGKKHRDLLEWDLHELTTVADRLGEITEDARKMADLLRGWRNLVHPGKEARGIIKPEREEADLSVRMIRLLARDLRRKEQSSNE